MKKISIGGDTMEGAEFFENEEIRSIVESVKYNGIVEIPSQEDAQKSELL